VRSVARQQSCVAPAGYRPARWPQTAAGRPASLLARSWPPCAARAWPTSSWRPAAGLARAGETAYANTRAGGFAPGGVRERFKPARPASGHLCPLHRRCTGCRAHNCHRVPGVRRRESSSLGRHGGGGNRRACVKAEPDAVGDVNTAGRDYGNNAPAPRLCVLCGRNSTFLLPSTNLWTSLYV
jgi:hypothetical protein